MSNVTDASAAVQLVWPIVSRLNIKSVEREEEVYRLIYMSNFVMMWMRKQ